MQDYLAEVTEKKYLTPNIIELTIGLIKPKSIRFKPGQFMFFKVNGAFKAYTIISSPNENHRLKFCVKLESGGIGSTFIRNLKIGERFDISGPEGDFVVRARKADICCIAGGVGIAPFVSIIPRLLSKNFAGSLALAWSASDRKDLFYNTIFTGLARKHPNFTYTALTSGRQQNRLAIKSYIQNHGAALFYLCGGRDFVSEMENLLDESGIDEAQVRTETFL